MIVLYFLAILLVLFGFVVFWGAPYVPTRRKQISQALALVNAHPGQSLLDLGSGDGAVLKIAAEQGLHVIGYELNPLLVLISRLRLRHHKEHVEIRWGNYWNQNLPSCDYTYVFGVTRDMKRLDAALQQIDTRLILYGFIIPGVTPEIAAEPFSVYVYPSEKRLNTD